MSFMRYRPISCSITCPLRPPMGSMLNHSPFSIEDNSTLINKKKNRTPEKSTSCFCSMLTRRLKIRKETQQNKSFISALICNIWRWTSAGMCSNYKLQAHNIGGRGKPTFYRKNQIFILNLHTERYSLIIYNNIGYACPLLINRITEMEPPSPPPPTHTLFREHIKSWSEMKLMFFWGLGFW